MGSKFWSNSFEENAQNAEKDYEHLAKLAQNVEQDLLIIINLKNSDFGAELAPNAYQDYLTVFLGAASAPNAYQDYLTFFL